VAAGVVCGCVVGCGCLCVAAARNFDMWPCAAATMRAGVELEVLVFALSVVPAVSVTP